LSAERSSLAPPGPVTRVRGPTANWVCVPLASTMVSVVAVSVTTLPTRRSPPRRCLCGAGDGAAGVAGGVLVDELAVSWLLEPDEARTAAVPAPAPATARTAAPTAMRRRLRTGIMVGSPWGGRTRGDRNCRSVLPSLFGARRTAPEPALRAR